MSSSPGTFVLIAQQNPTHQNPALPIFPDPVTLDPFNPVPPKWSSDPLLVHQNPREHHHLTSPITVTTPTMATTIKVTIRMIEITTMPTGFLKARAPRMATPFKMNSDLEP